jgi:hypothetical protein
VAIVTPFVQVGTYPTRNFATLGPFNLLLDRAKCLIGRGHFCRALYVAAQFGLSHPCPADRDGLAYSL